MPPKEKKKPKQLLGVFEREATVRTSISYFEKVKEALDKAVEAEGKSSSVIIDELLQNSPRIKKYLEP